MFKHETVFILGAGASCHYGYPTGEELVKQVMASARHLGSFFGQVDARQDAQPMPLYLREKFGEDAPLNTYWKAARECSKLARQIEQINPLVIDYFLADHKSLQDIGKLIIALVLLQCEGRPVKCGDWYRFLIHRLTYGCSASADLCENKVTFVTFNYDLSLDSRLFNSINSIEKFAQDDVSKFFGSHRILHLYGKLRDTPLVGVSRPIADIVNTPIELLKHQENLHREFVTVLDAAYVASDGIRTISDNKGFDEETMELARTVIEKAKYVYILGYGFDSENSRRIGLGTPLFDDIVARDKRIMFTNFNDRNRVNKEASLLFFHDRRTIL